MCVCLGYVCAGVYTGICVGVYRYVCLLGIRMCLGIYRYMCWGIQVCVFAWDTYVLGYTGIRVGACRYGVATVSRIDKIIGLFCRIMSLL